MRGKRYGAGGAQRYIVFFQRQGKKQGRGHLSMTADQDIPQNNGALLNLSHRIKVVMSSAAEAELGALFINAKTAVSVRKMLEEMGHPQSPTPIQTNNTTVHGVLTNKIRPNATKAMDMRFHWLRCREGQQQLRYLWRPRRTNLADY